MRGQTVSENFRARVPASSLLVKSPSPLWGGVRGGGHAGGSEFFRDSMSRIATSVRPHPDTPCRPSPQEGGQRAQAGEGKMTKTVMTKRSSSGRGTPIYDPRCHLCPSPGIKE